MVLSFGSNSERRRGYKAGTNLTGNAPAAPSAPVLGTITAQSGNVKRVAITTFPSNTNYLVVEVSYNSGATWQSAGSNISLGATYFDVDVSSNLMWSFRARSVNSGGTSGNSNVVSGATAVPILPTISAARLDATHVRYTFSGGANAASWTVNYRAPSGSGSYTSSSIAVGQATFDVAVSSGGNCDLYLVATNGAGNSTSSVIAGSAASADAFGITNYLVQSLNTGINNGVAAYDNAGCGLTAVWDGTYAVLTWPTAGNAGLKYSFATKSRTQLYVRVRVKAFQGAAAISKLLKMVGDSTGGGTPTSNFTFGPQLQGYPGGAPRALGLAYSDSPGGGDNSVSWLLDGTLSGGGVYSQTPHPTFITGVQTSLTANETLIEIFWKFNTNGNADGEVAIWIDGALKTYSPNVINCGTSLQKMDYVGVGELRGDAVSGSLVEKYRDFALSDERPIGRGI